jgi:O-antigen/teichoic acid export membrane protein
MTSVRKVLQGSASNVTRLALSVLVATVLPPVLVHHLSQAEYSAWVLILQLSTYITLLDLGLQTVVSKMIAENHAKGDQQANHQLLSTSFQVLGTIAGVGLLVVCALVWRVPAIFHQMPASLYPQVRMGLLLVGASAAFGLPFNPFLAVFIGLQRYGFPTVVALLGRLASATLLVSMVLLHASLVQLALAIALVNIATAIAQSYGWHRYVKGEVAFSFSGFHRATAMMLLSSGSVIAFWTIGELFVSGLDLLLVGHFDYGNTGFYAIAASATNFLLMIVSSLFAPILPAISAMQTTSTPEALGRITLKISRYCTLTLCALSLSLLVGAFPLLSLWVGHTYAVKTVVFLEVLVLSNFIRQLCYPYSLVVIATGKQKLATLAVVLEAVVNLAASLWLGSRFGAMGVAFGTLLGAAVSLAVHLTVSMARTRPAIDFSPGTFVVQSLLRPLSCVIPLLLLASSWNSMSLVPARPVFLAAWLVTTLLWMYWIGLLPEDRAELRGRLASLFAGRLREAP